MYIHEYNSPLFYLSAYAERASPDYTMYVKQILRRKRHRKKKRGKSRR